MSLFLYIAQRVSEIVICLESYVEIDDALFSQYLWYTRETSKKAKLSIESSRPKLTEEVFINVWW